jgi:probable HAF family extracellular repeat protein
LTSGTWEAPPENSAIQINNLGQIVGQSGTPDGFVHAFLWKHGMITDISTLSEDRPISQALGINKKGQIVGFSQDANSDESSSIALLWQDGELTNLNTLIPADFPWFLEEAFSINDRGQIVGHIVNKGTGEIHGFLATPVQDDGNTASASSSGNDNYTPRVALPENVRGMLQRMRNPVGRQFSR